MVQNRFSKCDLTNVSVKVCEWQRQHPQDLFCFRLYAARQGQAESDIAVPDCANVKDDNYYDEDVKLTSTILYLCDFHREQAWEQWVSKAPNGVSDCKEEVLTHIRRVAHASSSPKYVEMNVKYSQGYRKYKSDIPSFLVNRPRILVLHCKERIFAAKDIKSQHIKCIDISKGTFNIKSQSQDGSGGGCPASNFIAIFNTYPA
ncbi:unnamed protein product [Porites evermanni]|uniref:Uncharacterized protein n=1 Tax=Porites evermanni TaxID=104178 RepID=A0ABN8R3S2_9CNID|nr:unnamed protein product [Porites evermanni]